MSYRPFQVVVVPFPYSDRLAEKRRPALVVSDERLPRHLGRLWVAMITSSVAEGVEDATIMDLASAGLSVPSIVRASKIATIDSDRVLRTLGQLSGQDEGHARRALEQCAGF